MQELIRRDQCRARKDHVCELCGNRIGKGTEYIKISWREDGMFRQTKMHIHCDALTNEYVNRVQPEEYFIDEVREWAHEFCYECDHCTNDGGSFTGCERLIKRLLPVNVQRAAINSARRIDND